MNDPCDLWNRAIQLQRPNVQTCAKDLRPPLFEYLNRRVPTGIRIDNGVYLRIAPAAMFSPNPPISSVELDCTGVPPRYHILDVPLRCSAPAAASILRAQGPVVLVSEPGRWSILFGEALRLTFESCDPQVDEPDRSVLAGAEFFFAVQYRGTRLPYLRALPKERTDASSGTEDRHHHDANDV